MPRKTITANTTCYTHVTGCPFVLSILWILLSSIKLISQVSPSDCEGAIVLCGDFYSEDAAPEGTGNIFEYTGACNQNTETMSLWYTFTVQQDGILNFVLTPNVSADDYDWGLFEITNGGCVGINLQDGSSPEVSCSSYGSFNDNGPTGISSSLGGISNSSGPGDTNGPPFNADLDVSSGQSYALVVMNWSNTVNGFTIDFEGSTAALYDDISPTLIDFAYSCADTLFHVTFSEGVQMSTVELMDFVISDADGNNYTINEVIADAPGGSLEDGFSLHLDSLLPSGGSYTVVITNSNGNVSDPCGNLALDASFQVDVPDLI
ncbi:MAG: hypothetical protein ACKOW8_07360, partial [Flavobacteriales bacterium]